MDPQELAEAREDAARGLTQTAVRTRRQPIKGVKTRTGADKSEPVSATLPCRIRRPKNQRRVMVNDQDQRQLDAEAVFVWDADVAGGDVLQVDGIPYHVVGTDRGRPDPTLLVTYLMRSGQPAPSPLPERSIRLES